MANFIVVVDADEKRRTSFLNQIKPNLSPVDGLIQNECISEDFHSVWAATTKAPISFFPTKRKLVLYGEMRFTEMNMRESMPKKYGVCGLIEAITNYPLLMGFMPA